TGEGRAFCAGQDLREDAALDDISQLVRDTYTPIVRSLVEMPKPTIAAINGPAAGAGFSFALACDLRVMADDAILMMAFSNIGLAPDAGGSWFLARTVGYSRALELAVTGRRVHADEALALGLVQQVVAKDELQATVAELAATLAARPTQAIAWTKRLLRGALTGTLGGALGAGARLPAAPRRPVGHRRGGGAVP